MPSNDSDSSVSSLASKDDRGSVDTFEEEATVVVAEAASVQSRGLPFNIKKQLVTDIILAGGIDDCSAAQLAKNRTDGLCGDRSSNPKRLKQVENWVSTQKEKGAKAFEATAVKFAVSEESEKKAKRSKNAKPKAKAQQTPKKKTPVPKAVSVVQKQQQQVQTPSFAPNAAAFSASFSPGNFSSPSQSHPTTMSGNDTFVQSLLSKPHGA